MRSRMYVRDVVLSCVLAVGFVMHAQAEDQPASEAAPATPTQSTAPATTATESTAAVTPAPEDAAERERRESAEFERMAKQYKKMEKDGQTLYCRNEKTLGTRLAKPVCLTHAQLQDRVRKAEDVRTDMAKGNQGPCRPPAC